MRWTPLLFFSASWAPSCNSDRDKTDTGETSASDANSDANTDAAADANSDANVDANTDANADADVDADVDADADTDTDTAAPFTPLGCLDGYAQGTLPEVITGSTVGEGNDAEGFCASSGASEVQISYTAPETAGYVFDLVGSDFDTVLYLREACTNNILACNDDWIGLSSQVAGGLNAGESVTIVVDGFADREGSFVLNVGRLEDNESDCADGRDLDDDQLADCADPDCADSPLCVENCGDGIDNDGDFATDCFDSACSGDPICGPEDCDDGVDNDANAATDCADAACAHDVSCIEDCTDGVDNDGDGRTDCVDVYCDLDPACAEDCTDGVDNDGDSATDCFDGACSGDPICGPEICSDGVDNDADYATDCADVDCALDAACAEDCADGVDNDGDLATDCFDAYCDHSELCAEDCTDGVDNDGDIWPDCLDAYCDLDPACAEDCADGFDNDGDALYDCHDRYCRDEPHCAPVCPHATLSAPPQTLKTVTVGLPDTLQPSCAVSAASDYTWSFTAPADGDYTFDTDGSSYNTVLYALDGCGGDEIACDNNAINQQSEITVTLEAGQTIIVVADGFDIASGFLVLNVR